MATEEQNYMAKENARLHMVAAIESYFAAAGEYGHGAYDCGNEIADAVTEATEGSVKVVPEDV